MVKGWEDVVPTTGFVKVMDAGFTWMPGVGEALTVRVAGGLLVVLPTELLTRTVNWAPLFEVVSAGVV